MSWLKLLTRTAGLFRAHYNFRCNKYLQGKVSSVPFVRPQSACDSANRLWAAVQKLTKARTVWYNFSQTPHYSLFREQTAL